MLIGEGEGGTEENTTRTGKIRWSGRWIDGEREKKCGKEGEENGG